MTFQFRFSPSLELQLFLGDQVLGSLRSTIHQSGLDLFEGIVPQNVKIGDQAASGTFSLADGGILQLDVTASSDDRQFINLKFSVTNLGDKPVTLDRFTAPTLHLDRGIFPPHKPLWSMQGAAVHWGQDFAFNLPTGFSRDNYLGHLQDGEGGGIPVNYFWNKSIGIALMHIEPTPKDWYMPVKAGKEGITAAFELRSPVTLQPGKQIESLRIVVSVHHGDFFSPLALYRNLLAEQGIHAPEPVEADFEPGWCSWGYEFDVTPSEMTGVLPAVTDLGIRWLTLDDRWFDMYGDWNPRADTFPNGGEDMRRMNNTLHQAGAFSQIWWYPLCAEDGHGRWESHGYRHSKLLQEHPDWVILNSDGSVARNNRHIAMLCPALPEVQQHVRELTLRFIRDWDFDGHKLDNIYTIPACHNPAHHHKRPEESTEKMADVYRIIFETTRELRPNSVVQICPCGTPITLHLIPYTDQTVTADPTSSVQIRQRIKFYKALMGENAAVFADHVELSDDGDDFASEIGAGGIPSTKFIYPDDPKVRSRLKEVWDLPAEKRDFWKKWFDIYNAHRPAEGEYQNLYDLVFDQPETHVIRKQERIYYGFFADQFNDIVELRGLEDRPYRIIDYVNKRELGVVMGKDAHLNLEFEKALLVVAIPI
jgi:alpha-galactosidase